MGISFEAASRASGSSAQQCARPSLRGEAWSESFGLVLYDFRHTFATELAQAGVDLATLASILGHSSIRIVQRYVHPTAEHKKNAMIRFEQQVLSATDQNRIPN